MVLTRANAILAFTHVLDNVLVRGDQSPLKRSLIAEGINDIFNLVTLDDSDIDELMYNEIVLEGETEHITVRGLSKGDKGLLRMFLHFTMTQNSTENPINDDWENITRDQFDLFRSDPSNRPGNNVPIMAPRVTTASTTAPTRYTPADLFRRQIKRDHSAFPVLKDEKFNDSWHRSFINQARAQDIDELLDHEYKPMTQEQLELFIEKQKYLYAILENKVMTDRGKAIVREHETDFDAQKAYQKLKEHHLRSTKAMIESSTILSYITSVRLGSGEWKGTTEAFIVHWENQVRLYERQVPSSDHFSDGQKRTMLENAVAPIKELRQVKNNAELLKTRTGDTLTFDDYTNLLLSAATSYDVAMSKPQSMRRQVYQHDMCDFGMNNLHDEDEIGNFVPDHDAYGIDTSMSTIQVNMYNRQAKSTSKSDTPRVRMSRDKWFALSEDQRELWDKLDDKSKATILGLSTTTSPHKPHFVKSKFSRDQKANLHDMTVHDFIQAHLHETDSPPDSTQNGEIFSDAQEVLQDEQTDSDTVLINAMKTSDRKLPPGDIRRVMSKSSKRSVNVVYWVSAHKTISPDSLVDRGANGGVAGTDVRVIFKTNRTVDIRGIDNHQVTNIDIGTVGGVVTTQKGPVIAVMHQYALLGKGTSIHSPCQFEWYKNDVNDKSVHTGGLQRIKTLDGYVLPLGIKDGLARLKMRPYTDDEWNTLPHVFLTEETVWDPTVLDHDLEDNEQWMDALTDLETNPSTNLFDECGNYRKRVEIDHVDYLWRSNEDNLDATIDLCVHNSLHINRTLGCYDAQQHDIDTTIEETEDNSPTVPSLPQPVITTKKTPDYEKLRPLFGWLSTDIIKETFERTTQYARLPFGTLLKRSFKSPNPALNVVRRNEAVACDIVYADVPAVDDGSIAAVIFAGIDTHVTDIHGIKTDRQFINTLEDNIRYRGAPTKLISDRAQVEIGIKVQDILRALCIGDWQSEPHQQQQNPAERRFQTVKTAANRIMDRSGAPANTWLLCLMYVCFLLNHTYNTSIKGIPLQHLTGDTMDISVLLKYRFWQKVYYKKVDTGFPSESTEGVGYIVGISEHCGHALTYMVLTEDTQKVIFRSLIRPHTTADSNLRADPTGGESNPIIKSASDEVSSQLDPTLYHGESNNLPIPTHAAPLIHPEDLIGRTFLMDTNDDGNALRVRVVKMIQDQENDMTEHPDRLKFVLSVNNDQAEDIITYNQLLNHISQQDENDVVWKFRKIVSHQGPLRQEHRDYKGSTYNVMVEWENGEITTEPLAIIAADDPVTCAIYARDNGILDLPGWKRFKTIAKRQKNFVRFVNQTKLQAYNSAPRYKYGFEVPRNYMHAMRLDEKNKNDKWAEAIRLELSMIDQYQVFTDNGHHTKTKIPDGHKKIRVHFVFDVKHDGRHRARLVADGHLTDIPLESVYSGVVSLRGFRLVLFLAELNKMDIWATDIGNAYLEAKTTEKVYIIAGPEFGDREGHILVIHKALYGLRSSGARWHETFADCLRDMGFLSCKAEPDIWMRPNGKIYEYIAVYVDDLAIVVHDPKTFVSMLEDKYKFKLKGTGKITHHLGMDFYRDEDSTLCLSACKYIEKMIANYEKLFGESPKQTYSSPIEKGDHPEIDTSELLDNQGIQLYQSLIGTLQWAITIGRFDICTAVMTLSGFRVAPRRGHLDRVKRMYGYLSKMRHAAIRIRTEEPDFSDMSEFEYDWEKSVYGNVTESVPQDVPFPLGKHVSLTHYVDANLMHDLTTGRSVTGILHFVNKTPIDWYSKKQATVETATYGSEFVAARTCVEQIIDLRTTLRYLGVPIRDKSYMFGDNKSVVDSSMQIHAKLHKRHNMLSFHRVREAIASKMIGFHFINGSINPADIVSKHWGYSDIWTQLKTLLFWTGDTMDIIPK